MRIILACFSSKTYIDKYPADAISSECGNAKNFQKESYYKQITIEDYC